MTLCSLVAAWIIWSQVIGVFAGSRPAACTADLRYHSSWVLAQNGAATSLLSQNAVVMGAFRSPSVSVAASDLENGSRKPAFANSATNGGSRLIRSMEESFAARRRTSCSRCWDASLGSVWMLTLYGLPLEHEAASRAWPPLSGLMYQVRV